MNRTSAWIAGTAATAVLILVASWFLLISPQRSQTSSLRDQVSSAEAQNDQIKAQTAQLRRQFASLPERIAERDKVLKEIPDNPALPRLVRTLSSDAESAGVSLESIEPSTPAPLAAASGAGAGGAAGAGASAAIQQIGTSVKVAGTYAELTMFLQKLQTKGGRAFLVDGIVLARNDSAGSGSTSGGATAGGTADSENPQLLLSVTGRVFVLNPGTAASGVGAAPGPAGAASPAPGGAAATAS
ncbi:MAG: hypothetical protein ACRC35_05360 [Angustibacter sp.]